MNIMISETSGQFKSLYGDIQVPIASYLESQNKKDKENCLGLQIFSEKISDSFAEGYGGMTSADAMLPVGEAAMPPVNSVKERPIKTLTNETWMSNIPITRQVISDCKGKPKKIIQRVGMRKLTEAYYLAIDRLCFGLLNAAAKNKEFYTVAGKEFSTVCYDGEKVFSKNHKGGVNAFSDAFSKEALGAMTTEQQNFKDEKGNFLNIAPNTIIIPNTDAAKEQVWRAVGSEKDPGTANNGFNYQFSQWNVLIHPLLNVLVGADDSFPYITLDSIFNENNDGCIFQNREDLEITSTIERNKVNNWDAYARFTAGFSEWRQISIGGVSWGAAL